METKQVVLVVEDELVNRRILNKLLSNSYTVLEAENGQQAWAILSEHKTPVAAVLLDIIMPVMDGYGVLDNMRKAHMEGLPVIVMTGETDAESERRALDAGAWDFVTKPFNARVLGSRLSNAIARSQVSMYEEIQHLAQFDPLTGLYNRNKMFAMTRQLLDEHPDERFVFLRADINHFALFNASFGEAEGDKLLCYFAEQFARSVRFFPYATFGRISGDVFCACVPYNGDDRALQQNAREGQKLLAAFSRDYTLEMTLGAYIIEDASLSAEECYMRASMGAEKCKNRFGELVGFYDAAQGRRMAEELAITSEMQTALDEEQFVVYLQPKFSLASNSACGAEALVRWRHPVKGLISPGLFVPVFEGNGFIAKLDYYVWEKTCQMLRAWLDQGRQPFPISVNISRISLYNPKLVELMNALVKKYQISPALLQLEITESAYMTNPEQMHETIHGLRHAGFTILMDDFGSGYSSLNTLKTIEMDVLKVDMKFLPVGDETEKGEIILASVIRMANWLGMSVVVEGVETRRQRDFLEGTGCDCVQGFYYSRPIPQAEYEHKYVFAAAAAQHGKGKTEAPAHNVTILVIDDSEQDRAILHEYFSGSFHVKLCDSTEAGLAYLNRNQGRVRLILVDNVMPGMSGMEFLKYCQTDPGLNTIPQIMITANDNVTDQVAAFQAGAYDYITKPLAREVVVARVGHVLQVSSQLNSYEKAREMYRHQAELDKATGLLNKAAMREVSTKLMAKYPEDYKAMLVLDVDDFKQVNDQYGHQAGDEVLKTVAESLRTTFRVTDAIGRFGGDEFVVLMPALSGDSVARRKAEEAARAVTFACANQLKIQVGVSVGIAGCNARDNYDTLFARADAALYEAKKTGKGKVVVYGEKVPPIGNDDKPVVLICGEDPQLYPSIALAYGGTAGFANITSLAQLKAVVESYRGRICTICMDMQKQTMADADAFYQYIVENGGGTEITLVGVCKEGDMQHLQKALSLHVKEILTLPPQADVIQRRLSRAIMAGLARQQEKQSRPTKKKK